MDAASIPPEYAADQAGRYELLDELGSGGMASVYRAHDRTGARTVAFKQMHSPKSTSKRAMLEALFEQEYHALARLRHPRIIEVYDYGRNAKGPYYTMELLDGGDLAQLAPLPFRDACRQLRDVASSLALIHSHRLVHRDVTPRNVRLTADGRVKLIDFGALCTFGTAPQLVGTPPYMAPEALRREPLDQRADLFALGAVAYWALTGRHAYPARNVDQLPTVWLTPPPPPSHFADTVPAALDALVMSLLSVEALARPTSAAQVIDELTAIAELDPEEHDQAAESYLSSGPLVGRSEELDWLQKRVAPAFEGRGTLILIEGSLGIGKTRLIRELAVATQLRGAVVLRADAQSSSQAFGVAAHLGEQLLDVLPEDARAAAGDEAPLLAHLSDELAAKLNAGAELPLPDDPAELRARLQTALHEWFVAMAAERTLLLVVDNIQAADDNSAAFLAALGHKAHQTRLAVVLTQRTGEAATAPIPLRILRKRCACVKLGALDQQACEDLVGSLFGHAANTGRLAKLLFDKSGGNPKLCMDLAQLTVTRGVVKYVGGSWVLPLDVAEDELPNHMEGLLYEKLAELSPHARRLCEALSVHSKGVPIERCLGLVEGTAERDIYRALDELVFKEILQVEDARYGFRQQAVREAILAQVDEERRKELSRVAAHALLAGDDPSVQARVDAAWHLLNAGEEVRGADLMMEAARGFLQHQGVENAEQVVRAIETAITLYERQGRSKYEIARLLFPLMSLAFFVDWRVTLKQGERAIDLGLDITGLGLAGKLGRFLPDKVALGLGLLVAAVRFGWQQVRGLKYNLIEAIEGFCGLIPAAIGTQNLIFDLPAVQRFADKLRPLTLFGERHIAALMFDFAYAQYLMSTGREDPARELLEKLRKGFPDPAIKKVLGEAHWKAMYGGILFSLGCVYPYEFGQRALEVAKEMETLGVRVWAMAAEEVRMLYHAFRGETNAVQNYRERVELFAVQGSTTWQAEIFWPILLLDTEIRSGNTLAVRTIREQLARRSKDHASLEVYADVAHATHLTMRGEHAAAISKYESIIAELRTQDESSAWQVFRACFAYASALNMVGEHERAKQFANELLERAGSDVQSIVGHYLEPQRQLALAEAGLGNHERAVEILDTLLESHGHHVQPLLVGLLHKARAEVALSMSDGVAFERHFGEMERLFRVAANPSLIAQIDRLAAAAARVGLRTSPALPMGHGADPACEKSAAREQAFRELAAADNVYEIAANLLASETGSARAFLFLLRGERLELVAAVPGGEPPTGAFRRLRRDVLHARQLATQDEDETEMVPSGQDSRGPAKSVFIERVPRFIVEGRAGAQEPCRAIVLRTYQGNLEVVLGGLILEQGSSQEFTVETELLQRVAAVLHERSTVSGSEARSLGATAARR